MPLDELIEFSESPFVSVFQAQHQETLRAFIGNFFKCMVSVELSPMRQIKQLCDIDLRVLPGESVHEVNDREVWVTVYPYWKKKANVAVGVVLSDPQFRLPSETFLGILARQLLKRFRQAIRYSFDVDLQIFGEHLITDLIGEYIARVGFDQHKIRFVIDLFRSIRTTTFEDRVFNTGLIITRSHRAYRAESRYCRIVPLNEPIVVVPSLRYENRFWYLADGSSCFYVCDRNLKINSLFFFDDEHTITSFISTKFLSRYLDEQDVAFRTINGKEMVIVEATGDEFTYSAGQWHFRNYVDIKDAIMEVLPLFGQSAIEALMELIWSLMTRRNSSLIWIPKRQEDIPSLTMRSTRLWDERILLDDPRYSGLIYRLASSDGALVFLQDSRVACFGAIANIRASSYDSQHIIGSGELAAQFLSQSGVVIKVSQDGRGRVYRDMKMRWII
ncbi:MAG: hypothetical protein HQM03_15350 [Magnetococcales bacterium]|nr:hypothetical protein [Magnetococcales bacterium]